jgi:hypothetical protein
MWYEAFNHDNFPYDDASLLATELQVIPWPPSYKPPQLPMYDGHSDPKQFLICYKATISSYGGNTAVMQVLHHCSKECCSNMVFFSLARNNNLVAKIKGHVDHKLSRIPDEASHYPGPFPMYTR